MGCFSTEKKGTRERPYKFSYNELFKKGVIIQSDVPEVSKKKVVFQVSSEKYNRFDFVVKIAGIKVQEFAIELLDLKQKERYETDSLILDANKTIEFLNKLRIQM
jgi:hypothetical protein